jgi:phosphate uptake regulator
MGKLISEWAEKLFVYPMGWSSRRILDSDVEYIRADIANSEIARLEDIIAQMSGELTDAYMARDEADKERSGIATRAAYWQEMYQNTSEALRKTGDRLLEAIDGGAL